MKLHNNHACLYSLCAAMLAFLLIGCGYPEVSPKTYQITKALYSVCNQKNEMRLEKITTLVDDSLEKGEISSTEASWLQDIIQQASAGNWDDATTGSRKIMEDQIEW